MSLPPPDPDLPTREVRPGPFLSGGERRPIPRAPEPERALERRLGADLRRTARLLGVRPEERKARLVHDIANRLRSPNHVFEMLRTWSDRAGGRLLAGILLRGRVPLHELPPPLVAGLVGEASWNDEGPAGTAAVLKHASLLFVGTWKGRAAVYVPQGVRRPYAEALLALLARPDEGPDARLLDELARLVHETPPPAAPRAPGLPTARAGRRLPTPGPDRVLEIDVRLEDVDVSVWRRLLVSYQRPLGALHQVLQVAFGWAWRGPHWFVQSATGRLWADPRRRIRGMALEDEWETALRDVLASPGGEAHYVFDTSTHWIHRIVTRAIHAPELVEAEPLVIAAESDCPPADFPNPRCYGRFAARWREGRTDAWDREIASPGFDPDVVDVEAVNERLARLGK